MQALHRALFAAVIARAPRSGQLPRHQPTAESLRAWQKRDRFARREWQAARNWPFLYRSTDSTAAEPKVLRRWAQPAGRKAARWDIADSSARAAEAPAARLAESTHLPFLQFSLPHVHRR